MGHEYPRVSDTNNLNPEHSRSSRKNMGGGTNGVLNIFVATSSRSMAGAKRLGARAWPSGLRVEWGGQCQAVRAGFCWM